MLHIRPATQAELPLIQDLAQQTWPHTFGSILSGDQIRYMLEWMYSLPALEAQLKKGHLFLLAWLEDQPVGYAAYEIGYPEPGKTRIHKLYVLPQVQGGGAGKALMDAIGHEAGSAGNESLHLNVNRENPAVAFYSHLGFRITGEEKIPIGNGYFMDDYIMEKSL